MQEQTVRRYAPFAVAALVLALVGGVWLAVRDGSKGSSGNPGSGSGESAPLELVGWTPAAGGSPDPRYSLADGADLPDGPGSAPVHRLVTRDDDQLRAALGFLGDQLVVSPEGQWTAGATTCGVAVPPDLPVSSDDIGTAVDCGPARPMAGAPSLDDVRRALGLDGTAAEGSGSSAGGATSTWSVDPSVGNLPTRGLRTTLLLADASVLGGSGWLVRTPEVAEYPVVSATDAYQLLRTTPLPMPLLACPDPRPEGYSPLACGGPVSITGARLGLTYQLAADGPLLVPAWFFDVEGSSEPLVQVAVEPRLLVAADVGGGSSGSSGTAVPPVPASPSVVPPEPEPAPDPVGRFTTVTRGADDRTLDVTFWGGVDECYAYDVRVDESDQRVVLRLVEKRPDTGKVCIDLAEEKHRTVVLQEPLGLRTVEDGETGIVLLGPSR